MSRAEEIFKPAIKGRNIPVLTLDNKWHQLFTQANQTPRIEKMQNDLNDLLKRQGKLNFEIKDIKRLKKKLMDQIVELRDSAEYTDDSVASRKLDEYTRLINECKEKIGACQDELLDLPKEIDRINYELMLETMEVCYDLIRRNTEQIGEISEWINNVRIELKKNIVRKQEKELSNQQLYTYMHDIFGAEVIEIFDMKYNPSEKPLKENR